LSQGETWTEICSVGDTKLEQVDGDAQPVPFLPVAASSGDLDFRAVARTAPVRLIPSSLARSALTVRVRFPLFSLQAWPDPFELLDHAAIPI